MADTATPFRLRPARHSDQSVVKQMVRRARLNPLGLDWERFTVAVDGEDNIVGFIQLKPHGDGSAELASLVVGEPWRGHGVARALIAAVKGQSEDDLWLMCEQSLVPFYERFGFVAVKNAGQMPPYFRRIWLLARLFGAFTRNHLGLAIMHWQR